MSNLRPGVQSAKTQSATSVGEFVASKLETNRKFGGRRTTVGDLCDFCLNHFYFPRWALTLRKRGYKFTCNDCAKRNNFGKGSRVIWMCTYSPGKNLTIPVEMTKDKVYSIQKRLQEIPKEEPMQNLTVVADPIIESALARKFRIGKEKMDKIFNK